MRAYASEYKQDDIAIIGMSGRFPEADNLEEFWNNLVYGKESIREFPNSRKEELKELIHNLDQADLVKIGYLSNIALFEPEYFSISHEECRYIDPQQRLLIELVEEAILDAGYNPTQLSKQNVGIFLAAGQNKYTEKFANDTPMKFLNNIPAIDAGRIAYLYDFRGPAIDIDTACSSSLVALHYACQSLKLGEAELALAGGTEVNLLPEEKNSAGGQTILSADQKVRAFDKDANGTVAGEGGGIVILKLLSKAIEDGDAIHAVIKGSAVNSNGNLSNGIAAPSEIGQTEVILRCVENAKIDPLSISYIETHGTGTKIGDPIEAAGIGKALGQLGYEKHSVPIGSLKTNIGHLNYAAGIASVIKTVLSLEHKKIPASLNFEELNPLIDSENAEIYVNDTLTDWETDSIRRAGVTALGMVGTNCHVLLEEAPLQQKKDEKISGDLLQLSARTVESLQKMIVELYNYLLSHRELPFQDILYTLNTGRRNLKYKFVTYAENTEELLDKLKMAIAQEYRKTNSDDAYLIYQDKQKSNFKSIFIYPDMDDSILEKTDYLYHTYPQYREYYDELSNKIDNRERLNDTKVQYLIRMYAYSKLAEAYIGKPMAVLGIGLGELVADLVRKNRTFEDTLNCLEKESIVKKVVEEERLVSTIDKITKSGINLLALFCAKSKLENVFYNKLADTEQADFISFLSDRHDFAVAMQALMEKGLEVDWNKVYEGQDTCRLSLPGYVFCRSYYFIRPEEMLVNRCEINTISKEEEKEEQPKNISIRENLENMFQEVFFDEEYSLEDHTEELFIDSITIMEFSGKVRKEYGVDVPVSMFFQDLKLIEVFDCIENTIQKKNGNQQLTNPCEKPIYPASSAQKNIYIIDKLSEGNTSYNLPGAIIIEGDLDLDRFQHAVEKLIKRHEALRTSFEFEDNVLIQKIHPNVDFKLDCLELGDTALDTMLESLVKPFDLSKAPLIRISLIKINDRKYVCHYDVHHIICDGISMGILIEEIFEHYKGNTLPDLKMQFKDFTEWQESLLKGEEIARQEAFWLNTFSGDIPVLNLPTDFPRPMMQSFEGHNIEFKLSAELSTKLDQLRSRAGVTMSMLLLAAYNVLLSKYSGQQDIVVGSPISGRRHEDLSNVIGMFVNTIAIRNYPAGDKTFAEFLREVKKNASMAYDNQDYQFETLVEKLNLSGNAGQNPLFNCIFSFQNMHMKEMEFEDLKLIPYEVENKVSKLDLSLTVSFDRGIIEGDLEYCTKLYREETINMMITHYINILERVVENPEQKLRDIDMLSKNEKEKLIYGFNNTKIDFPKDKTIPMLFEEQVERDPNRTALIFGDQELTYEELNSKADNLACFLREMGVGRNHIIGLMVERSFEMIIGVMGILKAGGAYLPIDPEYPTDRVEFMLEDSGANVLLATGNIKDNISFHGKVVDLSEENLLKNEHAVPENINDSNDLAYIIYTSGSTGKPKGVMIEHKAVLNFITGMTETIDFSRDKTILALTTISFDIFALETLLPLTQGMKIVIANENQQVDPGLLSEVIMKNRIDMLQATPSRMQLIISNPKGLNSLKSLKEILVGGEALPKVLFEKLKSLPSTKLYNMYGPTETTVWSAVKDLTAAESINIGTPISNTYIYIVNKMNKLCPVGIPGELCISGESVARGYLNRPELTEERFINNPFIPGTRMYKTGDLACWLPNGEIEFIGRSDQQLKIRGYRIELEEIETCLSQYGNIKEVIVSAREDSEGYKQLCCYFTSEAKIDASELREFLSEKLPDYMIPSYFMQIEKMPMTPNGKVDRKLLPAPDNFASVSRKYEKPYGELEEQLALMWQEVLEVSTIGATDNFFEVGGHSLKAALLMAKINNKLNVQIALRELFKAPTIRSLAEIIRTKGKSHDLPLRKTEEREYYPVPEPIKAILKRIEVVDMGCCYNKTVPLMIEGPLDVERFENACKQLVKRYEILRTTFEMKNGDAKQIIHEINDFQIERIQSRRNDVQAIVEEFTRPFDMAKAPMFRVGLAELEQQKYLLILDLHQSVTDGISGNILIDDLLALYRGEQLCELDLQYKDYSVWIEKMLEEGKLKSQEEYWMSRLMGKIPEFSLPLDHERMPAGNQDGRTIEFELSNELVDQLKAMASEKGLTLYIILLACYNVLLFKRTKQSDIVVGAPVAARLHAGTENMMGMLANNIVMKNVVNEEDSMEEFLMQVRENALDAYQNQEYPFDKLVEKLNLSYAGNRYPVFDTIFTLHNQKTNDFVVDNLKFTSIEPQKYATMYDLAWHLFEGQNGIKGELIYSHNLFEKETAEKWIVDYIEVVKKVSQNPRICIRDLDL